MKTTKYFEYTRKRPDRSQIKDEWKIRKWAKISEVNKYLRVILLEDGETVHNAFFNRAYKEE